MQPLTLHALGAFFPLASRLPTPQYRLWLNQVTLSGPVGAYCVGAYCVEGLRVLQRPCKTVGSVVEELSSVVRAAQRGDPDAFDELVRRFQDVTTLPAKAG